jgi:hypothetical protein
VIRGSSCTKAQLGADEARRQAETTIRGRPADRARSRAFGQLALATALVAQGNLDEACPVAQDAIDATQPLGSFLVIEQILGLQHALRPYGGNKALAEFAARLERRSHVTRRLLGLLPDTWDPSR